VKYQLPIKIFVLKNNVLGMIRWEQMMFLGNPEFGVELQEVDFAMVARGFGMKTLRVEEPAEVAGAVTEALRHRGPVLVEAVVDAFEPLMPGQIKPQQAEKYAEALKRGQPNAERVALTLFRDAIEDIGGNYGVLVDSMQKKVPDLLPSKDR
jgi:pyruvate dehydrogenase (quinone)/pyruvate oxidase